MDAGTRACVAYVAGCAISGVTSHQVLDKTQNVTNRMKGSVKGKVVEVFDYERSCKIMGTLPSLIDLGTNTRISLEISGKSFSGEDKTGGVYFTGTVEGKGVKVHDYGLRRDFLYEI